MTVPSYSVAAAAIAAGLWFIPGPAEIYAAIAPANRAGSMMANAVAAKTSGAHAKSINIGPEMLQHLATCLACQDAVHYSVV